MKILNKLIVLFLTQIILLQCSELTIADRARQLNDRVRELIARSRNTPEHVPVHEAWTRVFQRAHHNYYTFFTENEEKFNRIAIRTINKLEKDDKLEINALFRLLDKKIEKAEKRLFDKEAKKTIYSTRVIVQSSCCKNYFHRGCLRKTIDTQHKCPLCRAKIKHYKKQTTYVFPPTLADKEAICPICIDLLLHEPKKRVNDGDNSSAKRVHTN